jgi:putative Mg2+ transporter-C (MgtC) family protein
MPSWEMIVRLLLAAGLGSVIGLERERLAWTAGLRTHMLVSVGSCLVIIVSAYGFSDVLGEHTVLDPSRIAAQVVSGIGFLGAGSIILRNEVVKGLTTAASLWAVAAVGLAVGAGLYVAAIATTVIILGILAGLKPLERRYLQPRHGLELTLRAPTGEVSVGLLERVLGRRVTLIKQITVRTARDPGQDDVVLVFDRLSAKDTALVIAALKSVESFSSVEQRSV